MDHFKLQMLSRLSVVCNGECTANEALQQLRTIDATTFDGWLTLSSYSDDLIAPGRISAVIRHFSMREHPCFCIITAILKHLELPCFRIPAIFMIGRIDIFPKYISWLNRHSRLTDDLLWDLLHIWDIKTRHEMERSDNRDEWIRDVWPCYDTEMLSELKNVRRLKEFQLWLFSEDYLRYPVDPQRENPYRNKYMALEGLFSREWTPQMFDRRAANVTYLQFVADQVGLWPDGSCAKPSPETAEAALNAYFALMTKGRLLDGQNVVSNQNLDYIRHFNAIFMQCHSNAPTAKASEILETNRCRYEGWPVMMNPPGYSEVRTESALMSAFALLSIEYNLGPNILTDVKRRLLTQIHRCHSAVGGPSVHHESYLIALVTVRICLYQIDQSVADDFDAEVIVQLPYLPMVIQMLNYSNQHPLSPSCKAALTARWQYEQPATESIYTSTERRRQYDAFVKFIDDL